MKQTKTMFVLVNGLHMSPYHAVEGATPLFKTREAAARYLCQETEMEYQIKEVKVSFEVEVV